METLVVPERGGAVSLKGVTLPTMAFRIKAVRLSFLFRSVLTTE